MPRVQVKVCGVTRAQDALAAVEAGADALGLVFHPPSPRALDVDAARRIAAALPPFVCLVGLFVNAPPERVSALAAELPLNLLQFHGDETEADCGGYRLPYIRALPVAAGFALDAAEAAWPSARALLLDGPAGGGGESFDWNLVPAPGARRHIVAGGLHAGNVARCVAALRPAAVDVSSGVESPAGSGVKSARRIQEFIAEVRRAERGLGTPA